MLEYSDSSSKLTAGRKDYFVSYLSFFDSEDLFVIYLDLALAIGCFISGSLSLSLRGSIEAFLSILFLVFSTSLIA